MYLYDIIIFIFIKYCDALPNMYCDPSFSSITKLVNDTYFVVDGEGNFWRVKDREKVRKELKIGKIPDLVGQYGDRFGMRSNFKTFDLTFMINFNGMCKSTLEAMFGLSVSETIQCFVI